MAEATQTPTNLLYLKYMLSNPAGALQLQQQQTLAAQMMKQGSELPASNETTPGPVPLVTKQSPLLYASKALQTGLGAYEQMDANKKLASMMQPQGQSTPQGAALGNAMGIPQNPAAPLTGDIGNDAMINAINSEAYKAAVANRYAGPNKGAEQANTYVDVNGHHMYPPTPPALQGQGIVPPSAPITSSPLAAPAGAQSNMPQNAPNPMEGAPPGAQAQPPMIDALVGPQGNQPPAAPPQASVDFNNPLAVKQGEATAAKQGDTMGDNLKTLNVMSSNLPQVLQRFGKMRDAAKDASYGPESWVNSEGTGMGQQFHNSRDDATGKANAILQQTSAQGVLPELGPQLAQAGIKGNKFLETLSSNASAIPMNIGPDAKLNNINGLENQYIQNFKSTAQQVRNNGGNAPSDADIDLMVSKLKGNATQGSTAGQVTHKYIPGQGIVPIGGQ